jgi:small GTP-binding protein
LFFPAWISIAFVLLCLVNILIHLPRGFQHEKSENCQQRFPSQLQHDERHTFSGFSDRMSSVDPDVLLKLILVGDSGVGKTNLLSRFALNEFNPDSKSTIGVEFATKTLRIEEHTVKAQIWDTAGQERYRAITAAYYRGALGAILVYNVTCAATFRSIERWVDDLRANVEDIVIILVGNKMDLADQREVATEEGIALSERKKLLFMETSAKDCSNVQEMFTLVISDIAKKIGTKELRGDSTSPVRRKGVAVRPAVEVSGACCGGEKSVKKEAGRTFQAIEDM